MPLVDQSNPFLAALDRISPDGAFYAQLPPEEIHHGMEAVRVLAQQALQLVPPETREAQAARLTARLNHVRETAFSGVNGFSHSAERFQEAYDRYHKPLYDGRSIYVELGTWSAWPDARVEEHLRTSPFGDVIRVDLSPAHPVDLCASVTALPLADESVDLISSNSLLEHVAFPHEVIREAFRILRPGGIFLTAVPFHFVEHACPNDYLRYTGQFFEEVCTAAGFETVVSDTYSSAGPFYTTHQLLKGCTFEGSEELKNIHAGRFAHMVTIGLLAVLQGFDDDFMSGGKHHFQATRALAVKAGPYRQPDAKPDRSLPFVDRYREILICPVSGLPLKKEGHVLVSLDGSHRYEIQNGVPILAVHHGFGSSFMTRASSRERLARWKEAESGERTAKS